MKKKLILSLVALVAISLGIVGMSAFEAHVVNVTARIENALSVPLEENGISFGTVFPEEVAYKTLDMSLSQSFLAQNRLDDVKYMLRQKPKCGVPAIPDGFKGAGPTNGIEPIKYESFVQVTDGPGGTFVCPIVKNSAGEDVQSVMLPLLCPYLSKTEVNTNGEPIYKLDENGEPLLDQDGKPIVNGIPAFHGPLTGWDMQDTLATQLTGRLSIADKKTSASWLLDLHAPCFKGMCAQDNVIQPAYQADPINEHQMFGCDLWIEVTDFSLPPVTLTVNKILSPTDDPGMFNLQIDSATKATDVGNGGTTGAISVSARAHTVGEIAGTGTNLGDYTSVISGDCASDGSITLVVGDQKVCTITNTRKPKTTLTVNKILSPADDSGKFNLQIDGVTKATDVGNGGTTGAIEVLPDGYTVGEIAGTGTNLGDYTSVISGDCASDGSITINAGDNVTCTITNTLKPGFIKVIKVVDNPGQLSNVHIATDFQMTIDSSNVDQNVDVPVAAGTHTIGEADSFGYITTYSGDCNGTNQVTVAPNDHKTCTVTNTVPYVTITVNKIVSNPHGGNDDASTFSLFVHNGVSNIPVLNEVPMNFAPGSFDVNEGPHTGYNGSVTAGDCDSNGHMSASNGSLTCTITNTETQPVITVLKNVVGGTTPPSAFTLRVDGSILFASSKNVNSNTPHTISEDNPSSLGYHFTSIVGTGTRGTVCPTNLGDSVTLKSGETITCTITNTINP
jgi:hypothetical protein